MLKTRRFRLCRQVPVGLIATAAGTLLFLACQGPDEYVRSRNNTTGAGGTATGGAIATGGSTATGGSAGSGLATGSGGVIATGGVSGLGGSGSAGGAAGHGPGGTTGGGGLPATGGASGAAGGAGVAGMRGTAGTAGGGGGGATCANCKLVIDAACQDGTNRQQGKVVVDVVNNASTGLPLSQVTFRYWFQVGEMTDPPTLTVDYAMLMSSVITSKFFAVSPARMGANEYFEIGFTSRAPTLALFSDTGQIQLRFNTANFNPMFLPDQTTDYSFQSCPAGATANNPPYNPNQHITGYINGVLVFGTEPM